MFNTCDMTLYLLNQMSRLPTITKYSQIVSLHVAKFLLNTPLKIMTLKEDANMRVIL